MRTSWPCGVLVATLVGAVIAIAPVPAAAQGGPASLSARFVDEATGLSLEQAIARALADEPALRGARKEIEIARAMQVQAGLRPNPTLTVEQRGEPAGSDNLTMVSMEWPLDVFRRSGRTEVARREAMATEQAIADRERRLAGDVRARYGAVLVAVRELRILDELVAAATRQRDLLRGRVDEGASPPLERNLVEVELQRLSADRLLQGGRTEAALIELKRAMGVEPATPLALRETLDTLVRRESALRPDTPAPAAAIVQQRPDVREADTRVSVAEARVDRAQREGRFDLAAYGAYMRMDSAFPQFGTNAAGHPERIGDVFHYVTGGLRITLPLRNRNQGEVAAARAARDAAEAQAEALRLNAAAEIAAARAQDEQAHAAVALYGDAAGALGLARQNLDVVRESYQLGRSTIFDVLTEQRRYLDLERGYVEALRAAFEARTALLLASGGLR